MAVGVRRLRKLQIGKESSPGTPVAADVLWRGMGVLKDEQEVVEVEEDIGYLGGVDNIYIPKLFATCGMESAAATYEQLPHIFAAGIEDVAGVQDGAGTDYIYTYTLATTAQKTPATYTIEGGDNIDVEDMEHAIVQELTLEGTNEGAMMVSANWFGRQLTGGQAFAALSLPATEVILASKGTLYIDPVSGAFGATAITNTLLDWKISVVTGYVPIFTADSGQKYFSTFKQIDPKVTLDITFEHETQSVAEKANWDAGTPRALQIKIEGSTFGTPGTTYTDHTFIANIAGYWHPFSELQDQNGDNIVKGTFNGKYNGTIAQFAQFIVVNELAALP